MTRVNLDGVDESVRQFVLAVAADPAGSVLELGGRPVAWVVPAASSSADEETWSDAKNQRRCDLIDRKYAGSLTPPEAVELGCLRSEEHTSESSHPSISYAVFCLKKKSNSHSKSCLWAMWIMGSPLSSEES